MVVLLLVYRELASRWSQLRDFAWDVDVYLLALSVAMHLLTFFFFSKVWSILIFGMGHHVTLREAFRLAYISNLARYVPGKFWPVFGMTYLAKQLGIRETVAVASWIIALMYTIPSSFLAAFVLAEFADSDILGVVFVGRGAYWAALALVLVSSAALLFQPNLAISVFNRLLRLFKRPTIDCFLKRSVAAKVFFGYSFCWISYGFAFWLLAKAVVGPVAVSLIDCISGFILSYQIGYLAFFAPGGFGVRELVLTHVMELSVGSAALGLAVIGRVWNLVAELIAAVVAALVSTNKPVDTSNSADTPQSC